jgi:hypothetical protein
MGRLAGWNWIALMDEFMSDDEMGLADILVQTLSLFWIG